MSPRADWWLADAEPVGRLGREGGSRMVLVVVNVRRWAREPLRFACAERRFCDRY